MPATITNATRVHSAISFIENLSGPENVYLFAGKIDPWDDENVPDPVDTNAFNQRNVLSSIIYAKKCTSDNGILGLKRYNWTSGVVYTTWTHDMDLSNPNNWLGIEQPFYVYVVDTSSETIKYSVFMCLDNNNGAPSTVMPTGQSYDSFSTADGYIWKFMYNLKPEHLVYLSEAFVPCPYDDGDKTIDHLNAQNNVSFGTVNKIRIDAAGSGYTELGTMLTIVGDGTDASATFTLDGSGSFESITMTNAGSGYTYVNVIITGDGAGVEVTPILSPIRGHGSSAHVQLCASHAMIRHGFVHDEGGAFPAQNSYRTIGLIKDLKDDAGNYMTNDSYNFFHELQCINITSQFPLAQRIIGKSSGATAKIFYQNPPTGSSNASFFVLDKDKYFQINETIELEGNPAVIAVIDNVINNITYIPSGNIIYLENIQFVTRKAGQTEYFVFTIEF